MLIGNCGGDSRYECRWGPGFSSFSPLFEITLALVCLDHIAGRIVNADYRHRVSGCDASSPPIASRFGVSGDALHENQATPRLYKC
jgi:hypothetical protein